MNLMRLVLLKAEGEQPVELSEYSDEQRQYHEALSVEAGLALGAVIKNLHGVPSKAVILALTWAGHDFLDAARNESTWRKVVESVKQRGLSITFDLLKELLTTTLKAQIGSP